MKSERRHELQTNELANWLARQYERHRGQMPTIAWGVLAVVAVGLAISLWTSKEQNSSVGAWEEFNSIGAVDPKARPKRLKELAERFPDSDVALWAKLDLADQLCFDGRTKLDVDREIATTYFREAQQTYAAVLQHPKAKPEMLRRAALAEGKCFEVIGEREKAIESYKSVAKKFSGTMPELAKDAAGRASDLEQSDAADFYKWLAKYQPPAAKPFSPPGFVPNFPPLDMGNESPPGREDSGKQPPEESTDQPKASQSSQSDSPTASKDSVEKTEPAAANPDDKKTPDISKPEQ